MGDILTKTDLRYLEDWEQVTQTFKNLLLPRSISIFQLAICEDKNGKKIAKLHLHQSITQTVIQSIMIQKFTAAFNETNSKLLRREWHGQSKK